MVYHLEHDADLADLDAQDQAILAYARKLNFEPATITVQDADNLREVGFEDREILDIAMVVCMFNFMNRLADGLGVVTNPDMARKKARCDERMENAMVKAANV